MRRQRPLESETRKENEPAGSKGAISSLAGLTRPSRRRFMTNEMAQCRADVRLGRHLAHLPDPPINNDHSHQAPNLETESANFQTVYHDGGNSLEKETPLGAQRQIHTVMNCQRRFHTEVTGSHSGEIVIRVHTAVSRVLAQRRYDDSGTLSGTFRSLPRSAAMKKSYENLYL
ncbi:hypothetical protein PCH_Pc16g06670 [Penicillium rubens Wisconsin 54-1255]|uniref:Uncharacterized protein n=1 Tax=Penicillium rubens (strain ATCC 28089 / DSM 1075 / NRRL 1951 / Wisconsin 54-1255) TaxID=500485 RepID=B6H7I0_PENRW|nr:hypothetical protein PCH_Pc16g06670 [Penicillium rubens Wisconsin 54-1255]